MDGTLSVCCCALFVCLATTQSRTVPTAIDYGGDGGGGGGGSSYYGGGTYYSGGGKTVGYGQRTAPAASNHRKIRDDEQHRDGQYAPYETAGTYEYMSNPSSGKNSRNRLPETERRPPGDDDVELIYDRDRQNRQNGGGGGGDDWSRDYGESRTDKRRAPAPGPRFSPPPYASGGYGGYGGGGGGGYVDSDRYGYVGGASAHAGPRYVDPDNKRRYVAGSGRGGGDPGTMTKQQRYYGPEGRDGGSDTARSSSSGTGEKKGKKKDGDGTQTKRKTTTDGGKGGTASAGKTKERQDVDVVLDEPGKRKVIKKNEYSKKREFFDEQHVKKPVAAAVAAATTYDGNKMVRSNSHRHPGQRDSANKKRKRRAKKAKKGKKRDGGGNFGGVASGSDNHAGRAVADLAPPSRSGYGQIMAVR